MSATRRDVAWHEVHGTEDRLEAYPTLFSVAPNGVRSPSRRVALTDTLANRPKFFYIPVKPVGIALNYWLDEMNLDDGDGARTIDQCWKV
jgi:hypothetical protein